MPDWINSLFALFSLPQVGLGAIFLISFLAATLLPLGSEAAVLGMVQMQPQLFWMVLAVATLGNTLGGAVNWWMGFAANGVIPHAHPRAVAWLKKLGAKECLFAWLPVIGDPLCAVAGWLRLPLGACVAYMAIGKFLRYVTITWAVGLVVVSG